MKKIKNLIKENWNDPVWSKVISGSILSFIIFTATSLVIVFKSIYSNIPIKESFEKVLEFLITKKELSIWVIVIITLLYLNIILIFVFRLITKIKANKSKEKEIVPKKTIPNATEPSALLFNYRMSTAFPGVRGLKWFENPSEAVKRLEILLKEPLRFKSTNYECESDPFWWFRGSSALHIDNFSKTGKKKVLLNIEELKIKRIAAYHGKSYFKDFIYIECEGEEQTGVEKGYSDENIKDHIEAFGYSSEEFGVFKNSIGLKKYINRKEYEDGATVIKGKVQDISEKVELRRRYLSPYNFIIAAKGSPYNSNKFSRNTEQLFNEIIQGKNDPSELFEFMNTFYKNEQ